MTPPEAGMAFMLLGGGLWVLRPIAGAIARRIGGEIPPPPRPEPDEETLAELQRLREDVDQLAERVDFTERLLARKSEPARSAQGEG